MLTKQRSGSVAALAVVLIAVGIGLILGFATGAQPIYLGLFLVSIITLILFFLKFEQTVMGLLILRSSLDIFSAQQIPAAFALGLNALTLLYVTVKLLTHQPVKLDKFWWFFAGWVALQGLWVVLIPLGGLGISSAYISAAFFAGIREWLRLFSWLMVYLLVMQLKDKIEPEKIITTLFLSLVIPLTVALIQVTLPASLLPSFFLLKTFGYEAGSRINGTLGHAATFASLLLLFIGLTWWKIGHARKRWPWLLLLITLSFFLVSTKALTVLGMLLVFIFILISPRLNLLQLIGGILLFALVIGLFASTQIGQERFSSLVNTPLLNPDIDISRAIILSWSDGNSFNWRIAQWTFLLQAWQNSPILGYGLNTCPYLTVFNLYAHNDYIRALVEGGIVGFITFLIFIGAQIYRLVHLMRSSPLNSSRRSLCLVLLGIFSGLLLGMLTDNILTHTTLFFYWWLLLAVAGWDWGLGNGELTGPLWGTRGPHDREGVGIRRTRGTGEGRRGEKLMTLDS